MKNLLLATVAVCVSTAAMAQAPITVVVPAGVQQNPAGGNQNNCGRPTLVAGGATVAVVNDNAGHIYFSQSTGIVRRLNLAAGTISPVASGLSFGARVTAGLMIDEGGNLLIGEASQIDRISATDLATIQ